eukprot:m.455655 g.455655  ORF g.455655 m.455655 type:complete len:186 (-) comp21573_c0_seq20:2744-3301(-)
MFATHNLESIGAGQFGVTIEPLDMNLNDTNTQRRTSTLSGGMRDNALHYNGRHHMVDVTGAIINDEILFKVGHAMVDAMEEQARLAGARPVHKHIEVFDDSVSPPGFTSVVLLDESHITAHCYSRTGEIALDVFTCGAANKADYILENMSKWLKARFPGAEVTFSSISRFPRYATQPHGGSDVVL